MYKKQLLIQKLLCLAAIIMSALVFLYSLGIMTDLYDSLYKTMPNPDDHTETYVQGSIVYYNMQGFNQQFLKYSIVLILLACLLFITNTNVRRRYYIGNYISIAAFVGWSVYLSFDCHRYIEIFKARFLQVDFEKLKEFAERRNDPKIYNTSTFWFDIHYLVFGLLLVVCILLVLNCVWKVLLMKEEKNLLGQGKGAKA